MRILKANDKEMSRTTESQSEALSLYRDDFPPVRMVTNHPLADLELEWAHVY